VLQSFRYQRNRRLLQGVILLVITAWLALALGSTCAFPPQFYAKAGLLDCLSGMTHDQHTSGEQKTSNDCIESCTADQAKSGLNLTSDTPKGFSLLPALIGSFACFLLLSSSPASSYPRPFLLPRYKPVSLIYRFCSLLN
jgi:hypothetical protein